MSLRGRLSRLGIVPLARRYIVMNSFDGVLVVLGIIVSQIATKNAEAVFHAGIASGMGLAISGVTSAYMAEKAERDIEVERLERAMLSELKSRRAASKIATMFLSIINGISPLLAVLLIISPFAFLVFEQALYVSIVLCSVLLFTLGAYLARISDRNMVAYGLQMLMAGLITALLTIGFTNAV